MTDAKEPILLKVVAPPSHTALSGDVTVFILDTEEIETSTVFTSIAATNGTNGIRKDENEQIDPRKDGVNAGHEPLVLRYVKKSHNLMKMQQWCLWRTPCNTPLLCILKATNHWSEITLAICN